MKSAARCIIALCALVLCFALPGFDSPPVQALPSAQVGAVNIRAEKDTWLDALNPNNAYPQADYLRVGNSECTDYHIPTSAVALIQWDLSAIPAGVTIEHAEVWMYQFVAFGGADDEVRLQLHPCAYPWPENVTYANRPFVRSLPGNLQYYAFPSTAMGWKKLFDIPELVGYWVTRQINNNGVWIWSNSPVGPAYCNQRVFRSIEFGYAPELRVTYSLTAPSLTPTGSPTATSTATPTLTRTRTRTLTPTLPGQPSPTPTNTPRPSPTPTRTLLPPGAFRAWLPLLLKAPPPTVWIELGAADAERGVWLDDNGDVDSEAVTAGNPPLEGRRTGNGAALPAPDGNDIPDYYLQLRVDDGFLFAGQPSTRVRVEVWYWDQGRDSFELQYDAVSGGPLGDGRFKSSDVVFKTDSRRWRLATFYLDDAWFANRDHDADLRISDQGDGAEIIRTVSLTRLPPAP